MHSNFPNHQIDPKMKNREWCLQFCKACWKENDKHLPEKMFYRNSHKYDEIKSYMLGRQSITKYKKAMGVDEQSNTTFMNIDFSILPVIKKHRQIALGKLQKVDYNIVATPIDALARDESEQYYAEIKAKLLLREEIARQNPELLQSPVLAMQTGEPQDMEELEIQAEYGFKHNMAIEAETGIQVVFEQNDIISCRHRVIEDLFDFGVAVTKDYIDENKKVRFRNCDVRSIITNYCQYPDFRDLLYCGEVLSMTIHELKSMAGDRFTNEDYEVMADSSKGTLGNPRTFFRSEQEVDRYKVKVLDLEWYSVDEFMYEKRMDKRGNMVMGKAPYDVKHKNKDKYIGKKYLMVYKAKWVVGTDFIFDFGVSNYIKRDKSNYANAEMSYHIYATNFWEMTCKGIGEDLMPIADQVQIAWLKLQNIRNQLLPFLIEMDLTALEGVAYGKGGEVMKPKELVEMMFQTGILVTRRADLAGTNINYKSVEYIQTNYGAAINEAWNDLLQNINLIRELTGFNELTDGSTPNPKTLTTPAQMAYEATNNSLYQIVYGEKCLLLKLSKAVLCRLQKVVKDGNVQGYVKSLGTNSMRFFKLNPEISVYEFGIMLEDKPTVEQKQLFQQHIQESIAKGELDITDAITVENVHNLKQAQQLLAHKIKKRREQMQRESLEMQQANAEAQMQSAQAAEQSKQQTLQLEWQLRTEYMMKEKEMERMIKEMELSVKYGTAVEQLQSKERMQRREAGEVVPEQQPVMNQQVTEQQPVGEEMAQGEEQEGYF